MIRGVLSHWLDRGVDGFLIQSAAYLYEDPEDTAGFSMTQPSRDFIAKMRKLTGEWFPPLIYEHWICWLGVGTAFSLLSKVYI